MNMTILLLMIGGGTGAIIRLLISDLLNQIEIKGLSLPFGTLLVNSIGSFAIGLLSGLLLQHQLLNVFLVIGVLGGLTTFSTLQLELLQQIKENRYFIFILYGFCQYIGCFLFCWVGYHI
ncbi:fluoride efflux transporter CrcB [Staphylococcus felis]|nr:fluoride efflux transporter CrcB [Staphylococcus felis]PNZ34675.1 fluoride efflux transporter CrcB [Staphylococcus felis]QQB04526.1 fluoride efflux transporter CrcB [Staphylococcus felis]REH79411.1 fluoride efflux transporter CrcB [Staphylococcus felis]REH95236.1 fluoride efflux transporter CrcB [Staphylococcus felis]